MSFLGDIFSGKQDPVQASVVPAATQAQANQTFGNTQDALAQQNAFLQALQAQGGIQNQSNVFNQMAGIANGTGPNPAAAALNNATGQNVANTAALMAGQRGAGQNAGLIARQAGMAGANMQQQAAGQGAQMQAQQQMNALNAMGNMSGQMVQNQAGAAQALNNAALQGQANVISGVNGTNTANVAAADSQNKVIAENNKGKGVGGIMTGISDIAGGLGKIFNQGGEVPGGGGPSSNLGRVLLKAGGSVPGTAKVSGDSVKNDTVPALLSPGEIVIPRTITQGPDAAKKSAEFVAKVLARKRKK